MGTETPDADDRNRPRRTAALLEALKAALAEPGEHRLYKSGKLAGLFPGRSGVSGDAAAEALRDGLLEPVRTETKGKTTIEWVRLTPRGVEFVHANDSPRAVLGELQSAIQSVREAIPAWLERVRGELRALETRFSEEAARLDQRLDALGRRVEDSLRRADAAGPALPDPMKSLVPWGLDALTYLDRRKAGGGSGDCPLPELFASLRERHPDLSVADFHDGLRRLRDTHALRLEPCAGPPEQLPEPELALPDGAGVLYYAGR